MSQPELASADAQTYTALYRRWRPQLFSQVVGQKHVTRTLQNALAGGRVAHAYLFCGLRGTGKTTMAKLLARALNCLEGVHPEPCNNCASCLEILEGRSMDVLEIDAASNRGIDEIRDLRDKARYATAQSRYKVYIVDEVHMLTNEAFNALLKILEEPPPKVIFILATTEVHKLPLTVVSRCQRFDFHLLEVSEIAGHLQNIAAELTFSLDEETLYLLARQAEGSMRDALGFLEQCRAYGGEKVSYSEVLAILGLAAPETIFNLLEAVLQEDIGRGLAIIGEAVYQGRDLHRFIRELILYLRKLVILPSGEDEGKILADVPGLKPYLHRHKDKFDSAVLLEMLEILQELTFQLRNSSQPQFLLELTFLRLVRAWRFRRYLSPGSLFQKLEELEEKLQASAQLPHLAAGTGRPGAGDAIEGQQFAAPREAVPAAEPGETAKKAGETAGAIKAPGAAAPAGTAKHPTAEIGPGPETAVSPPGSNDVPNAAGASAYLGGTAAPPAPHAAPGEAAAPPGPHSGTAGGPGAAPPPEKTSPPAAPRPAFPNLQGPELQAFWEKRLLPEIKKQRHTILHALLQEAEPLSCKEGVFTFAFPPTHSIHKGRTESSRHRKYLESLLTTMLGIKTEIRIMLQEKENNNGNEEESSGENAEKQRASTSPRTIYPHGDHSDVSLSPGNVVKDSPASPASTGPAGKNARDRQADDYYMQQMVDLFNGKLLTTDTEELDSHDFWEWNISLEEE